MNRLSWPSVDKAKLKDTLKLEKVESLMLVLTTESEKQTEDRLKKQQYENYIPPEDRRPADEFYSIESVKEECIGEPFDVKIEGETGTFLKYMVKASKTKYDRKVESSDVVYHTCETRFENGQLVDFTEKRRVKQKFEMGNPAFIEHKRRAFATMKAGEVAWFALSKEFTSGMYHRVQLNKFHDKAKIGELIYIKLGIESIKKQPMYANNKTFEGRKEYFETIRELCKELMAEGEFVNAKDIYQKCLGEFNAMPRKIKDTMTEEQKLEADEFKFVLHCNLSLCHLKRNVASDAIT